MDFDTRSLVCEQIANQVIRPSSSGPSLDCLSRVCHAWRSAALPYLFRHVRIDLSYFRRFPLQSYYPISSCEWSSFVRELRIDDMDHRLNEHCLDFIITSIAQFRNLTAFMWYSKDNLPRKLFNVLNDHENLTTLWIRFTPDWHKYTEQLDLFSSAKKPISILTSDWATYRYSRMNYEGSPPPHCLTCYEHLTRFFIDLLNPGEIQKKIAWSTGSPMVKTLVFDNASLYLWARDNLSLPFDTSGVRRLSLVNCFTTMALRWSLFPKDLESLEIVDPVHCEAVDAGTYIIENVLAAPLNRFPNLTTLKLRNLGAPIREVLINLIENGRKLQCLEIHDQEMSGIDACYKFERFQQGSGSDRIDCDFAKLLVYVCPNLQSLSVDISAEGLERHTSEVYLRRRDARSIALEPVLEKLAEIPSRSVSDSLCSLKSLRSLRLRTPFSTSTCNDQHALATARSMWSAHLECFTQIALKHSSVEIPVEEEGTFARYGKWQRCVRCKAGCGGDDLYLRELES
ncbi:MAG: hypothetical protein Q9219_003559 [cf. Caloplaca sp. 3 TL-2023]